MSLLQTAAQSKAVIELVAKDDNFKENLENCSISLQEFSKVAVQVGTRISLAGAAMVLPFKQAAQVFAQFDDAMRTVGAVTGATAQAFENLTNRAKQLGAETSFSAQQVADGMASLGRMGFNSSQINNAIDDMMNLSRATGTDLAQASEIAANNMAVFGINASKAAKVADTLALTANSSAQTLTDLGEALKTAGPFAKTANQSLKQTSAALGVLANMGIRGSMAGTALSKTYKRLADPKVREYLKTTFGVDAVDAAGNLRDVATVLGEIGKAISGLGNADQIAALEEIFDARGALAGGQLSINTKGIDELLAKYRQAEDYAKKAATAMDKGLGGAARIASSALEGLKIAVGEALAPALIKILQVLTGLANLLKSVSETCPWLITGIAGVAAGMATLGTALAAAGASMLLFNQACNTWAALAPTMLSMLGKMAAGMSTAATAIKGATLTSMAKSTWNGIKSIVTGAIGGISASLLKLKGVMAIVAKWGAGLFKGLATAAAAGTAIVAALVAALAAGTVYLKKLQQGIADTHVNDAKSARSKMEARFKQKSNALEDDIKTNNIGEDDADKMRLALMEKQFKERQRLMKQNSISIDDLDSDISWKKGNKRINGKAMEELAKQNVELAEENAELAKEMSAIKKRIADAPEKKRQAELIKATQAANEADKTITDLDAKFSDMDLTPVERELKAMDEMQQSYIDALKAKKAYYELAGNKEEAQKITSEIETVEKDTARRKKDILDKSYRSAGLIDIDADLQATQASMGQKASDFEEEQRLKQMRENDPDKYMNELKDKFRNMSQALAKAAVTYRKLQEDAKSDASDSGAIISEQEKATLDDQRKSYEQLKKGLQELQSRILDAAQEANTETESMEQRQETFGGFLASAFSMMGANSTEEKIASGVKDTAKNTKETLDWLRQQDFGVSFA